MPCVSQQGEQHETSFPLGSFVFHLFIFSSGIFCVSQPSCCIRLQELLQAAGEMSSLGFCFLSMFPEVNSLLGGNFFPGCSIFACRTPRASLWKCCGVVVSQQSGGPALSHLGFVSPPGWPLGVFHVHCASPAEDLFGFTHGGGLSCLPVDLFLPTGTFDGNFIQVSGVSEVTEGFVELSSAVRKLYGVLLREKWAELNCCAFWTHREAAAHDRFHLLWV